VKKKSLQTVQIIIAIGFGLLGFLVPLILDHFGAGFITSHDRFVVVVSVVSGVILISSLIGFTVLFSDNFRTQKEILSHTEDLVKRVGVTARLLTYGPEGEYPSSLELVSSLVAAAEKEIVVLDYLPWAGDPDLQADMSKELQNWYTCLENASKRGVIYKRIVQLQDGATNTLARPIINNQAMIRHFQRMLKLQSNESLSRVSLKTSRVFLPGISFIVIDRRYVFWEIPYLDGDGKFVFDLDLFFNDANGQFVNDITKYFTRIDDRSTFVKKLVD
jgi:hypothetical protein